MTKSWTVLDLIKATASFLGERGSPSPRVDAEVLLAHQLGLSRTQLYMAFARPIDDEEREQFRALVKRRADGVPVAYITGTRGFWTLDLAVDERVLIPRPETERIVELALEFVGERKSARWRIVDVGTGSGCIALALASELPNATVLGIDISADALEVARENAETLGLRDRVRLVCGDGLEPLRSRGAVVDIIVSNPPYIDPTDERVETSVRKHEPDVALFAGRDGLDVVRELLRDAPSALASGGLFLCEIGQGQHDQVLALPTQLVETEVVKDYGGVLRTVRARKAGELVVPDAPPVEVAQAADEEAPADASGEQVEEPQLPEIDIHSL